MPKIASKASLPCWTQKSMITIQLHRVTILYKNKQSVQKVNSRFRNKKLKLKSFQATWHFILSNLHKRLPKQTRSPVCVSLEVCAAHKPRVSSIGWNLSNGDDKPHTTMFHCENVTRISSSLSHKIVCEAKMSHEEAERVNGRESDRVRCHVWFFSPLDSSCLFIPASLH